MKKGTSVVLGIFVVAIVMGLATWPLLKIRRQKEIRRTEMLLQVLKDSCEKYKVSHGRYPASLADLKGGGEPLDAWRRPVRYAVFALKRHGREFDQVNLWSDGPDLSSTSDDIHARD